MNGSEHCAYCGRSLAPAAQYCGGCGNPVSPDDGPPTMAVSTTVLPSVPPRGRGAAGPRFRTSRRRRLTRTILAVAVILVIAIVAIVVTHSGSSKPTTSKPTVPTGPIVMPSLLTLTRGQALSRLDHAGVAANRITVKTKPSTEVAPDVVLGQDPAAGVTLTGRVTVTVSQAPVTMPDFVGHDINSARATLSTLNITLSVHDQLDGTVPDGTVLTQSPAAGAPMTRGVSLTVARTPIASNLGDLQAVGTAPARSDAETIGGSAYADSLIWDTSECPGSSSPTATYNLDGRFRQFVAIAGIGSETANAADQVHLDISVDGTVVLAAVLNVHSAVHVQIDVTQHHQLAITFTPVTDNSPSCSAASAALGRAHLLSIVGDLTSPTT